MKSIPQSARLKWLEEAGILIEALPYMRRYSGQTVVVKFGGNAMGADAYIRRFAENMVLLRQIGAKPVVVHGGGPQIGEMLDRIGIKSEFKSGLRISDADTVAVAEMVLSGTINKSLVSAIIDAGAGAVGISGKDADLIRAQRLKGGLGFVGAPKAINGAVIDALLNAQLIPVIAPIARGAEGETLNINADTVSGALAGALGASRLLLLSDVPGIMDKDGNVIPELSVAKARKLIKDGTISGGMIPKVETCIDAVESGAEAAVILDGRESHAVLVELFTEHGIGTLIKSAQKSSKKNG